MVPAPVVLQAVGALGKLLSIVMKIKEETTIFKRTLEGFQLTLIALTPVVNDMERLNHDLGRSRDEVEPLITKMVYGTNLVCNCSKIQWFNCVSRRRYLAELKFLQEWLLTHLSTLEMAHSVRDKIETKRDQRLNEDGEVGTVSILVLPAPDLYLAWGDTDWYWTWTHTTHPSFPEVAELRSVCWLEIRGWIKTSSLHSNQSYEAYFVFSKGSKTFGFDKQAVEVSLKVVGEDDDDQKQTGYLEPKTSPNRTSDAVETSLLMPEVEPMFEVKIREDGLREVKLGEFSTHAEEDKEVQMGVHETKDLWWKGGIIVQGIEIRPK